MRPVALLRGVQVTWDAVGVEWRMGRTGTSVSGHKRAGRSEWPIAVVLLAAGASTRMGGQQKLLFPFAGKPSIRLCAECLLAAGVEHLIVVVGVKPEPVVEALAGLPLQLIHNRESRQGMGRSIAAGVQGVPPRARSIGVALGDMPLVRTETIGVLLDQTGKRSPGIVLPAWEGRWGHPVFFDATRYRRALESLGGDQGARSILLGNPEDIRAVAVNDPGVVRDFDCREDYERLRLDG